MTINICRHTDSNGVVSSFPFYESGGFLFVRFYSVNFKGIVREVLRVSLNYRSEVAKLLWRFRKARRAVAHSSVTIGDPSSLYPVGSLRWLACQKLKVSIHVAHRTHTYDFKPAYLSYIESLVS